GADPRALRRAHHSRALWGYGGRLDPRGLLLLVEASSLRAVSAVAHVAPASRAVAASIEEDPFAGRRRAFLDPVPIARGEEIRGRACDPPERSLQLVAVRRQRPANAVAVVHESRTRRTRRRGVTDKCEIVIARRL